MPHKRGKKRAERRERAAVRLSNETQLPGPIIAAQQPIPNVEAQQYGPSNAIQHSLPESIHQQAQPDIAGLQPGPGTTEQSVSADVPPEGNEEARLITTDAGLETDQPTFPGRPGLAEHRPQMQQGPSQQANVPTEISDAEGAVPTDVTNTEDDHAQRSVNSQQTCYGNVNSSLPIAQAKKRRGQR